MMKYWDGENSSEVYEQQGCERHSYQLLPKTFTVIFRKYTDI